MGFGISPARPLPSKKCGGGRGHRDAILTARHSCCKAGKARIFTPVWESVARRCRDMRKITNLAVASTIALLGALALWAVWDALANANIVEPQSLRYFLPIVCVWAAICLGFGVLFQFSKASSSR